MGLFSRLKGKDKATEEPVAEKKAPESVPEPVPVPAESEAGRTFKMTFRCPQYFKADPEGVYYVIIDGESHKVEPLKAVSLVLPEGMHNVRVYSYPETLDDVNMDFMLDREKVLSVSVNVLKGTMKIFDYQHP